MICHFLYKIRKLIRMRTTLPCGSTIWSKGKTWESIQQSLQESLDNAICWFSFNGMKRANVQKTMQMLIGTAQKLRCADKTCMSLFLNDVKLEEATGEKLLGIRIDKYVTWNLHIDYIIRKLNCRISPLKRWNLDCGKLLYNSLTKPIIEYCCTVCGNYSKEQLDRFLRLQERCARIILDANFQDNSGMLFIRLASNWRYHSYKKTISSS